ncbi:MAG TPA: ABC transporter permease subunit [Anaerolineales bacterium]|nr:ABC transporter permease subunit [Anaerolineales bacterium]
MNKKVSLRTSLLRGLLAAFSLLVFAYGFQVTQVSFDQINSPTRQESLKRVLRALARPDLFAYEQIETTIEAPISVPCSDETSKNEGDTSGPYLVLEPPCADPDETIRVQGYNFMPNMSGPVFFIPPSGVKLSLGKFQTDENGYFDLEVELPPRPNEQVQTIRTITREPVGSPQLTKSAKDTWDKIIETVFLALLATAFGIILAVPISFFAARNLMEDVTSPMTSLSLSIIGWPIGIYAGIKITAWVETQSVLLTSNLLLTILGIILSGLLIWAAIRWALPHEDESKPKFSIRLARLAALLFATLIVILLLYLVSVLFIEVGSALNDRLGSFGFLGTFLKNIGEILALLIGLVGALIGGAVVGGWLSRPGQIIYTKLTPVSRLVVNMVLGALAGGFLAFLIAGGLIWLYQYRNINQIYFWFIATGTILGILTAILTRKTDALPTGIVVYTVTRTVLNILRAIEALIWVIVFVVWVGIGPFAGVLALTLHTIAALAKLYSEQVESILPGPMEAVKATGANRLQAIVYAVIPQIVPPYISFTIYRWDINVRMSTIIGFAGGGGIGFLLFQNINLLNYRAASAQMVAITIVVALMDYFSAYLRQKVV